MRRDEIADTDERRRMESAIDTDDGKFDDEDDAGDPKRRKIREIKRYKTEETMEGVCITMDRCASRNELKISYTRR